MTGCEQWEEKQLWFTAGNRQRTFPAEGKYKSKTVYHSTLVDLLEPIEKCPLPVAIQNTKIYPHSVLICVLCFSEHAGIISLNSLNWFVFIMKMVLLFCDVGTEFLFTLNSVFKELIYYIWISRLLNVSDVETDLISCEVPLILFST
jgi:hypothetical protein